MTVLVVEALEIVHVEKDHSQGTPCSQALLDLFGQGDVELVAVENLGQAVERGLVSELFFQAADFGNSPADGEVLQGITGQFGKDQLGGARFVVHAVFQGDFHGWARLSQKRGIPAGGKRLLGLGEMKQVLARPCRRTKGRDVGDGTLVIHGKDKILHGGNQIVQECPLFEDVEFDAADLGNVLEESDVFYPPFPHFLLDAQVDTRLVDPVVSVERTKDARVCRLGFVLKVGVQLNLLGVAEFGGQNVHEPASFELVGGGSDGCKMGVGLQDDSVRVEADHTDGKGIEGLGLGFDESLTFEVRSNMLTHKTEVEPEFGVLGHVAVCRCKSQRTDVVSRVPDVNDGAVMFPGDGLGLDGFRGLLVVGVMVQDPMAVKRGTKSHLPLFDAPMQFEVHADGIDHGSDAVLGMADVHAQEIQFLHGLDGVIEKAFVRGKPGNLQRFTDGMELFRHPFAQMRELVVIQPQDLLSKGGKMQGRFGIALVVKFHFGPPRTQDDRLNDGRMVIQMVHVVMGEDAVGADIGKCPAVNELFGQKFVGGSPYFSFQSCLARGKGCQFVGRKGVLTGGYQKYSGKILEERAQIGLGDMPAIESFGNDFRCGGGPDHGVPCPREILGSHGRCGDVFLE